MAITLRADKGSQLTQAEGDTNFSDLRDGLALQVPKTQNAGIKTDSLGTPSYPWHDIIGNIHVEAGGAQTPEFVPYQGGIKALQFALSDEGFLDFHIPHDYVVGTEVYIHVHWSHTSTLVTGGTVTWGFEMSYAKGHNQGAFLVPVSVGLIASASSTQYQHMIPEVLITSIGGGATSISVGDIEPDGIVMVRVYLDSNDITVSGGLAPEPFVHFVDLHYQSTGIGTKQKSPDFWT